MSPIERAREKYYRLLYLLKYPVWTLSGAEKNSGLPLTAAFAGIESSKNYFGKMVFGDAFRETSLGARWFWDVESPVRRTGASLLFCDIPEEKSHFVPARADFFLPAWVEMEVDLSGDIQPLLRRDRYSKIRREKIQRHKLTPEIRTDEASFDDFYYRMYEPHMKSRHEASAVVRDYESLKRDFLKKDSELLLVMKDGESISGLLNDYRDGALLHYLGVRDASPELFRLGASEAAYYFSILRAKERGYDRVSLGHCRPFTRDGVFQYKTHYAAYVKGHHRSSGRIGVSVLDRTPAADAFFAQNPFVSLDGSGYAINFFKDAAEEWAPVIERHEHSGVRIARHAEAVHG